MCIGGHPKDKVAALTMRSLKCGYMFSTNSNYDIFGRKSKLILSSISLLLKVVKKNGEGAGLLSEIGDDGTRGAHSLLHRAFSIELGKSTPRTEILPAVHHDDGHLSLSAQSTNELLVLLVLAVLGEAAEAGRATVEGLGALV